MSGAEISLIAVVVGFAGLLAWVYWPGNRGRLDSYGAMPLEDDGAADQVRSGATGNQGERQ